MSSQNEKLKWEFTRIFVFLEEFIRIYRSLNIPKIITVGTAVIFIFS